MLLYDWKRVFNAADGNPRKCVIIMEMLIKRQVPNSRRDRIFPYSTMDFSGECFLIHPDVLVYNSYKYTHRELAIYYALASCRSLGEWRITRKTTLDVLLMPVDLGIIDNNRLLYVEGDQVHFLYEEVQKENIH